MSCLKCLFHELARRKKKRTTNRGGGGGGGKILEKGIKSGGGELQCAGRRSHAKGEY